MMPLLSWLFRQPTSATLSRFDEDEDFDCHQNGSSNLYSNMIFCNGQVETNEMIRQFRSKFESTWSAVNFGEEIISSYMNFCQSKHEFQPAFWHIVNHNLRQDCINHSNRWQHFTIFRKRCLSFLTSLDLFQNMPVKDIFRKLRGNLNNVSMLAYIFTTNQNSADAELRFIMGSKDYGKQF